MHGVCLLHVLAVCFRPLQRPAALLMRDAPQIILLDMVSSKLSLCASKAGGLCSVTDNL